MKPFPLLELVELRRSCWSLYDLEPLPMLQLELRMLRLLLLRWRLLLLLLLLARLAPLRPLSSNPPFDLSAFSAFFSFILFRFSSMHLILLNSSTQQSGQADIMTFHPRPKSFFFRSRM